MAQVGRISGPLLEENLLRNGIDLAFRNDLDTTQLLYLDVANGRIGVNTATPTNDLHVVGTLRTTNLIGDYGRVAGFTINNSTFSAIGNIELNAAEAIVMPALDNGAIFIDGNYISTTASNANIDLIPNGSGIVEVVNDLDVLGNLHATGNITADGNIVFGDAAGDKVDFNADVSSDLTPDEDLIYDIGKPTRRFILLEGQSINGNITVGSGIEVDGANLVKRSGNAFYVSVRGADTNHGDHPSSPFATVKRALEASDASLGGPVTIHITPGVYQEELPLIVPPNVSIVGEDLRNCIITPDTNTQSEDVFLLNGETSIRNITIKDFYFDSNKGYAFRYAPGGTITSRSPYIRNVTVITHGTNTTIDDPLGFNSGDAGRGAYIDGAELDPSTREASMLFHSVTMITPGADAVVMTNGVRVEWLNSFTYYANRGLYAFNNSTGRTTHDGSTVNYGAEIRSIGSACVYGNYGAVADGADTLMYLINHNFGYIGSGKNSSNDPSTIIQENETVEENGGRIFHVSQDQYGTLRVGDNFYVDFETGSTSVDLSSLTADSLNGIVITSGGESTVVTGAKVETGNLRIQSNIIESLSGDLIVDSGTNEINYNDNVNISGNTNLTGNLSFGGNLNLLGDQTTDVVKFNVDFDQNFNPNQDLQFNLGSPAKRWKATYLSEVNVGDIRLFDNVVTTKTSNADLELRASGTGLVLVPSNNVTFSNNFNVAGDTSLNNVIINGVLSITGDTGTDRILYQHERTYQTDVSYSTTTATEFKISSTGSIATIGTSIVDPLVWQPNYYIAISPDTPGNNVVILRIRSLRNTYTSSLRFRTTFVSGSIGSLVNNQTYQVYISDTSEFTDDLNLDGSFTALQNLTVGHDATFEEISIIQNYITTTSTNADLELRANGIGNILVPNNDVRIDNDMYVDNIFVNTDVTVATDVIFDTADISNIVVTENYITSDSSNADLELRANGSGIILIESNDVEVDNNLGVNGTTYLKETNIFSSITQTGNRIQTGLYVQEGDLHVTGQLTTDRAVQFENILIDDNVITTTASNSDLDLRASGTGNVIIPLNNVRINNNLFASSLVAGNIVIDQDLVLNELIIPPSIIEIDDNFISTKISNADLDLRANGTGNLLIPSNDVLIEQVLTVNGYSDINNTSITGNLTQTGNRTQTGNYNQLGDRIVTGQVSISSLAQFENIQINGNVLETTLSNSDIELRASGSGIVLIPDSAHFYNDLSVETLTSSNINIANTFSLELMESSTDIDIFDNVITTTNSNSNLELRANGSGSITLQSLLFNGGTISTTISDITLESDNIVMNGTGSLKIPAGSSTLSSIGSIKFDSTDGLFEGWGANSSVVTLNGVYSDNRLTSVTAHPTNNLVFFRVNGTQVGSIDSDEMYIHGLQVDDISIQTNIIKTTVSNSDLEITANGTGVVTIGNFDITDSSFNNNDTVGGLTFSTTGYGYAKINSEGGMVVPNGGTATQPVNPPQVGDTRWNTDTVVLETWDGTQYITSAGVSAAITAEEYDNLLFEYTIIFG